MQCPFCNAEETKVIDSRLANDGDAVRRRVNGIRRGQLREVDTCDIIEQAVIRRDRLFRFADGLLCLAEHLASLHDRGLDLLLFELHLPLIILFNR